MNHCPLRKFESPTMNWVRLGRSADSPGWSATACLKALANTGTMKITTASIHQQSEDEDHHRIHRRRADLPPQRVELLELVGDPLQSLVETARALARAHHGSEEVVEDLRTAPHCVGQRAAGLHVPPYAADRLLEPLVLRLVLERVERAQHRHARCHKSGELPGEDRELARLDPAEAIEDRLELEGLVLLGDVEHDQPALAKLLGDLSLGIGVNLATRGHTCHVDGTEREGAHLRLRSSLQSPAHRPPPAPAPEVA